MLFFVCRFSPFDDVTAGRRLAAHQGVGTKIQSLIACAFHCQSTPTCKSYNFCYGQTCQLNSIDVLQVEWPQSLIAAKSCKYVDMKRTSRPHCFQNDISDKDISDDTNPGICKINQKRTDEHWKPVQLDIYLGGTKTFNCVGNKSAHGGSVFCDPGKIMLPGIEIPVFSPVPQDYATAYEICRNHKGTIFDDVQGLKFSLKDISYGLTTCMEGHGSAKFLTGITDENGDGKWIDSRGQDVTSFLTWSPQPSSGNTASVAACDCKTGLSCIFHKIQKTDKACYACWYKTQVIAEYEHLVSMAKLVSYIQKQFKI